LLTYLWATNADWVREDTVFNENGQKLDESGESDVRGVMNNVFGAAGVSERKFAWVGIDKFSGAMGVISNRDVLLFKKNLLQLKFNHPTRPTFARFVFPDLFVVVDAEAGRLVVHDLGETPMKRPWFATGNDIGAQEHLRRPYYHGAWLHNDVCAGDSMQLADGRKIFFNTTPTTGWSPQKREIRIVSDKSTTVMKLDEDTDCIQFSDDWKNMLVRKGIRFTRENVKVEGSKFGVVVYDFDRVSATGVLEGNEIGALPLSSPQSAFFVGRSSAIVTTFGSNGVLGSNSVLLWRPNKDHKQWESQEVYRGENDITYAEPDAKGDRLLLIENVGGGEGRGFLYSLSAREEWLNLGKDYRFLNVSFTSDDEIVVSKHSKVTNVFPLLPFNALVELAGKQLSPSCRPATPGDFRSSPCWPLLEKESANTATKERDTELVQDPNSIAIRDPNQPVVSVAQPLETANECDLLAADPYYRDLPRGVTGVKVDEIDAVRAVPACRRAVVEFPNVIRFQFELARAVEAEGYSNTQKALQFYRKAAGLGSAEAQNNIGMLYQSGGSGFSQDYRQARSWYRKAADQGYAIAEINIGSLCEEGKGDVPDYEQAISWYRKAADQGNASAQLKIGSLFEKGKGVEQDYGQAISWYQKAANQGSEDAKAALKRLSNKPLPDTKAEPR
jgi:Sel1 repeat